MVRASARKLTPEAPAPLRKRKVRKVINIEKVRRFLQIGGLLVLLTMANASIQALVAQTQYRLAAIQYELKVVDQQIGWLQWELVSRVSQQQVEKLAVKVETEAYIDKPADSLSQLHPKLVLPPSILLVDPSTVSEEKPVTAKLYDWVSGLGRTLAKGASAK